MPVRRPDAAPVGSGLPRRAVQAGRARGDCFFCTAVSTGESGGTRPMSVRKVDGEGHLKTWFTEGIDDPRITVIRFAPEGGYYWDNKHGNAVAGIKMLIGAAIGKTLDDSIEGRLGF